MLTDPQLRQQLRRVGLEIIDHATDDTHDVKTAVQQAIQTLRVLFEESAAESQVIEIVQP